MARLLGEGEVKVGDKVWRLRFDMNVLADLEESTGKSAMAVLAELDSGDRMMASRRTVCLAMLKRYHPEATAQDAGDILSEDPAAFMAILQSVMPQGGAVAGNGGAGPVGAT